MKTLSECLKEHVERNERWQERELRRAKELWAKSAELPLYAPPDPEVNRTDYGPFRAQLRDLLFRGKVELYELACDFCKTQLMNHEPGVVLTSNPPQTRASCPGCGWLGSVPSGTFGHVR
jgi:hypothetical protein